MFRKPRFSILNESLLDVRKKNASALSDEQFARLLSYDPILSELGELSDDVMAKSPESYSRWLLGMNKRGQLNGISPDKMKKYLKAFTSAKNRRNLLPNNDINSYKTFNDLENAIEVVKANLTVNQKNKDAKRNQKELSGEKQVGMYMDGAVELLFNGNKWEVWTPHTFVGSKALRRGATWCTGGDDSCHYDNYTTSGRLYVIISKNNPQEKYQLFVPINDGRLKEFRDKSNDSVNFRQFVHDNPELLEFFMTDENVLASYENLDDLDAIDTEWDDSKEDDVISEYDLDISINELVALTIDYHQLVENWYYTSPDDYEDVATHGYLESGGYGDVDELKEDIIHNENFVIHLYWKNTQVYTLYKYYLKDSGTSESDLDFNAFLYVLFNTNEEVYNDTPVYAWLSEHCKSGDFQEEVVNTIGNTIATDTITEFIRTKLEENGWYVDTRKSSDERIDYMNQFKDNFMYELEDCHSIQQFYEEIADFGRKSKQDIISEYDITINEARGAINPKYAEYDKYEEDGYMEEDAKAILDLFMSIEEFNNFDDDETEEEIDEVLRLAGVK